MAREPSQAIYLPHSSERRRPGVLSIWLDGVYLDKVEVIVTRHFVAEKVGTHKSKSKPSRSSGLSTARRTVPHGRQHVIAHHCTFQKSADDYDGEGAGMPNRSHEMISIQNIDIDARHGPLRRSTSILHPLRLPTHLHACSLLVIPVANPDRSKDRPDLYSQHR